MPQTTARSSPSTRAAGRSHDAFSPASTTRAPAGSAAVAPSSTVRTSAAHAYTTRYDPPSATTAGAEAVAQVSIVRLGVHVPSVRQTRAHTDVVFAVSLPSAHATSTESLSPAAPQAIPLPHATTTGADTALPRASSRMRCNASLLSNVDRQSSQNPSGSPVRNSGFPNSDGTVGSGTRRHARAASALSRTLRKPRLVWSQIVLCTLATPRTSPANAATGALSTAAASRTRTCVPGVPRGTTGGESAAVSPAFAPREAAHRAYAFSHASESEGPSPSSTDASRGAASGIAPGSGGGAATAPPQPARAARNNAAPMRRPIQRNDSAGPRL